MTYPIGGHGVLEHSRVALEFSNALDFDGSNDKCTFTSDVVISASQDFTIAFYSKLTNFASMAITNTVDTFHYVYMKETTKVGFNGATGGQDFLFPGISLSVWNFVVISRISNTMRCYVNNVESTSGGATLNTAVTFDGLSNRGILYYDGVMDEVFIKAGTGATAANATSMYNGGAKKDLSSVIASPDIYLLMDESGSDTTATDSSGNSNDATLTNFTLPGAWVTH